jgi:hypothetical protein
MMTRRKSRKDEKPVKPPENLLLVQSIFNFFL